MAHTKNEFYLRRVHSLLGIIPIGAFLVVHLMVNHQATQGAEAFNKASMFMESLPFLIIVEFLFIYIPILYHGLYGIHIAFTAKENIGHYSIFRNWMFALQRVTGVITFIFIFVHLWQTRLQKAFFGKEVNYDMMHQTLQHPLWAIIYMICIVAVVFHFANGIWSFLVTWGILQSKKSQQVFTWVSLIVFLILSYIGVSAIVAFM
ncbi:succinate dehydrogenase, cytochrome b556 subunit [Staphylococcus lugdunensis]|uniref:Succinate dehydrogenase, cytochrome b556 subunit n=1 Tax=Staphylococcus lugdunensis TaxID=28035 RepID=A0A292DGM9_STALU|nr:MULTISPECIES: succinate dehydrogenase, cytochrome b556 subunit [Staphylococcus]ADC87825.1 Succinate dehydrogenase cytochrome b558 subunit [Staphylococcus lugdunensis HKU09-01]AMG60944.1 succinate dehydrogenase [Staphylococcus lugdunensis]AMG62873.1 succinate dehydrogenase, cytochrome b556 subunit [Staphylococcus lugdunensis]ARB78053.1 succinate dehydrogenase, cytochrome b556 subunit [Staphylococcus lugdunensis]ARJ09576.1 succinate dehydrogenase, cytochrome b556 subunit [Staphylococcus lugdu